MMVKANQAELTSIIWSLLDVFMGNSDDKTWGYQSDATLEHYKDVLYLTLSDGTSFAIKITKQRRRQPPIAAGKGEGE
jgi:hypothetical protein